MNLILDADAALETEYELFWDDLLREAEVSGDPQRAAFFRLYEELAAANGDSNSLTYAPVLKEGRNGFQVDGYDVDTERGELHLVVCDFRSERTLQTLQADGMRQLFGRARRFLEKISKDNFVAELEETSPAFELANRVRASGGDIRRIRCLIFSNARLATRSKTVEEDTIGNIPVTFNVIDFSRYLTISTAGDQVEPIELDIEALHGRPLECLQAHVGDNDYESYLIVMPGELLASLYGKYGARLMEQNVRTFLQARTKVNRGIIESASKEPEMFFAYNNGITATATAVTVGSNEHGGQGIRAIRDLQIVNGGQTTASLLHASDRNSADLSRVFVQMKLSVVSRGQVDAVVPLISRFANTQNRISEADFFSGHAFHVEVQRTSLRVTAPVAEGSLSGTRWYYERARGQYRNEAASRSSADRRRFEAEFPKKQVVVKTDLAKYQLTFECRPHVVSQGAQKCFLMFADATSKRWESHRIEFNDEYFRHAIAKAILFRWTDQMVGKSDWYRDDRGYKANIVTYTLARLAHYLEQDKRMHLDYDAIWKAQQPPAELADALRKLAPAVSRTLKSPPQGIVNISEYSKRESCWARVSGTSYEFPEGLLSVAVTADEQRKTKANARAEARIDLDLEFETLLLKLGPRARQLREVAESENLLSPRSAGALDKLARGSFSVTRPEKNALVYLFERLKERGTDVTELV